MGEINKMSEKIVLAPQKGPQEMFIATSADICIYGGAAGGGKTFGLLLDPLRYINNGNYGAVIFRKNYIQVTNPGGLWDSSRKIYGYVPGATAYKNPKLHWRFKSGATVNFAHLTKSGDSLWAIAQAQLGKGSRYEEIFNLNKDKLKNVNSTIYPGMVLTLPTQ